MRSSRNLDASLTGWDYLGYRFHYYLCYTCRKVEKQWKYLNRELRGLSESAEELTDLKLSDEARCKIHRALEEQGRK